MSDDPVMQLRKEMAAYIRRRTWNATYLGKRLAAIDATIVNFTGFFWRAETPAPKGAMKMGLDEYMVANVKARAAYFKAVKTAFERLKKDECQ